MTRFKLDLTQFRLSDHFALKHLQLEIGPGEFVGILGPNGSGKTTVLRLLAGVLTAPPGSVVHNQAAVSSLTPAERAANVAYVPQQLPMPFPYTVAEMVLQGQVVSEKHRWWNAASDLALTDDVLRRVGLVGFAQRRIDTLSGGEYQRMLIAKALAQRAPAILLDEPTSALDIGQQAEVCDLLTTENVAGQTIVVVFHDLNLAALYCKRLLLLNHGEMVADGPPEQILTFDILRAVYGERLLVDSRPDRQGIAVLPTRKH